MSDEVFSTILAYTKSPKVTKRTSFQVSISNIFILSDFKGKHCISNVGFEMILQRALCNTGVYLTFLWMFYQVVLFGLKCYLLTLLCGLQTI